MIYILLQDTIYHKKVLLFIKSSDILVDVVRNADLAQLAEHLTSNEEVEGSNPLVSIRMNEVGAPIRSVSFLLSKNNSNKKTLH